MTLATGYVVMFLESKFANRSDSLDRVADIAVIGLAVMVCIVLFMLNFFNLSRAKT